MATIAKPNPETQRIDKSKRPDPQLSGRPVDGARYTSKSFMDAEWEAIWTKAWLIGGLAEQVQKPGDFFTYEIGRESILVTHDDDGEIRAFYNVCPHRGKRLVAEEQGNSKRIACSYHGWRFATSGDLQFVPCPEDFAGGTPCGKVKLEPVKCEVFAGFIWVNLDPDACTLREHLGPVMDEVACYRMENMIRTHWVTLDGDFNWKCVQDNFNESYHLPYVHPQTRYVMEQNYKHCQFDMYEPEGHARMLMPGSIPSASMRGHTDTVLEMLGREMEYWGLDPEDFREDPRAIREALQAAKRKQGAEKGYDYSPFHDDQLTDNYHYTVFPNVSFSLKPDGCIFLRADPHPTDPERCIFDMWYFTWFPDGEEDYYSYIMAEGVDRSKPVEHVRGAVGEISCGPAIDQDVEIWSSQQAGLRSRGFKGGVFSGQEGRIQFFHDQIDKWLEKNGAQAG